jgi:hypothetical protein
MAFLSTCFFATVFVLLVVMNRKAAKDEAEGSAADPDTSRPTA